MVDGRCLAPQGDEDGDGRIDAIESSLPTADADGDCIPDEEDPQNDTPAAGTPGADDCPAASG